MLYLRHTILGMPLGRHAFRKAFFPEIGEGALPHCNTHPSQLLTMVFHRYAHHRPVWRNVSSHSWWTFGKYSSGFFLGHNDKDSNCMLYLRHTILGMPLGRHAFRKAFFPEIGEGALPHCNTHPSQLLTKTPLPVALQVAPTPVAAERSLVALPLVPKHCSAVALGAQVFQPLLLQSRAGQLTPQLHRKWRWGRRSTSQLTTAASGPRVAWLSHPQTSLQVVSLLPPQEMLYHLKPLQPAVGH